MTTLRVPAIVERVRAGRARLPKARTLSKALEANALVLALSSAATGALGFVFWVVAEQCFPTAVVGRASAVINSATMLSTLSGLALGGMYERFLPLAGRRAPRLVLFGLLGTTVLGAGAGVVFVLVGPAGSLFADPAEAVVFPLTVAVLTCYALLDPILIGAQRPRAVAVKNIGLSILKIAPLPLLAASGSALAVTGSWTALAFAVSAVAAVVVLRAVRGRGISRLPSLGLLARHHASVVAIMLMHVVAPLAVPLIVLEHLGAEAAAHFNIAWIMVSAVGLALSAIIPSYVVEASAHPERRADLTRRIIALQVRVAVPLLIAFALLGPLVLQLVGPGYSASSGYLLCMAAALLLQQILLLYGAFARILGRLRLLVVMQCIGMVGTVAGAVLLIGPFGLTGVGVGIIVTDVIAFAVVAVPMIQMTRAMLSSDGAQGRYETPPHGTPPNGAAARETEHTPA
ncbi:lipopolysaccharide biosynthesis protein [Microbacterium sp. No. 7]|uniref:lipopolysaccharide biosynthesis protein n=1 Tax=Microbacterium sp. No. 7 TaxID=1714373 RepID=UPI0006D2C244|nr:hypothetical protein [Microbacterium sp. No. 7]